MLTLSEYDDGFVAIGDSIIHVSSRGSRVKLSIDAPQTVSVKRSDVVRRLLTEFGFTKHPIMFSCWLYNGQAFTTREAWSMYNDRIRMDKKDSC